jgi:hypothetical protein
MKKAIIAAAGAALAVPFLVIGTPVAHADMCQIWASLGATAKFQACEEQQQRDASDALKDANGNCKYGTSVTGTCLYAPQPSQLP